MEDGRCQKAERSFTRVSGQGGRTTSDQLRRVSLAARGLAGVLLPNLLIAAALLHVESSAGCCSFHLSNEAVNYKKHRALWA